MTKPANRSPARIVWVSHSFGYGGDLMYFGEIFRAFREHFPSMTIAVDRNTPYDNPHGLALVPIMRLMRRKLRRRTPGGDSYDTEIAIPDPGLLARLVAMRPRAIIAIEFTPPALLAIVAAAIIPGCKLVLLVESDPAARGGSRNPLVLALKRRAARRADVVQTNNPEGRRYVIEDLRVEPRRVVMLPYLTSRPPGPAPDIAPREGPLRLLFANSIVERKGLGALIDALGLLAPEKRKDVECTVVGDGPLRDALEARARELGMAGRMRFVGHRSYAQLGDFYADADVLVSPSLADYRSLAGFEGLGYGLVLLASARDGATAETVVDGENGWVIDPADPQSIAHRIAALVSDRAMLARMRAAALQRYAQHFSIECIAANLAASVERALGESKSRD